MLQLLKIVIQQSKWNVDIYFFKGLTDPVADVQNFIREFNDNYGGSHPQFYHGTYSEVSTSISIENLLVEIFLKSWPNLNIFL